MNDTGWRIMVPGKLAFGVLLFLLPWINLSCSVKDPSGETQKMALAQQSGLQAAIGSISAAGALAGMEGDEPDGEEDESKDPPPPAILLWGYLIALVGGAAAGFSLALGAQRRTILGAAAGVAVLCLLVQTIVGFPVAANLEQIPQNQGPGELDIDVEFTVDYQPAFYLSWLVGLAAIGGVIAEAKMRIPDDDGDADDGGADFDPDDDER